jgi:hypothetical protein
MLTLTTPLPTSLRGQIRARVKAHRHWPAFLHEKGLLSASARNADLIEFALRQPDLKTEIEQVLSNYAAATPHESAAVLIQVNRLENLLRAYAIRRKTGSAKPRIRVSAVSQTL